MDKEDIAIESQRVLKLLDERAEQHENLEEMLSQTILNIMDGADNEPNLPERRKPQTLKELRHQLVDAWTLLSESHDLIREWQRLGVSGLAQQSAAVRQAICLVDDAISATER